MLRFNILTAITSMGLALSAHALALTGTDGPAHGMAMHGDTKYEPTFTHFDYVNPWPRPYQDPHPPIWVPSQGSTETIEWAAHPDRKYTYLQTYSPFQNVVRCHNAYRQIGHLSLIYI